MKFVIIKIEKEIYDSEMSQAKGNSPFFISNLGDGSIHTQAELGCILKSLGVEWIILYHGDKEQFISSWNLVIDNISNTTS